MQDDLNRQGSIKDREYFSWTKDHEDKIAKRVKGSVKIESPFGTADNIKATFPTDTQTLYTYSFNGTDIGTILVTYTDSFKDVFLESDYNEL